MILLYYVFMVMMGILDIMAARLDREGGPAWRRREGTGCLVYLLVCAAAASGGHDVVEGMLYCILFTYMAAASYSDLQSKKVYRFFAYPAVAAGAAYMIYSGPGVDQIMSYGIYVLLQLLVFRRFLGRADILAFMVSGLFFFHRGMQSVLLCGMIHMLLAIILLAAVKFRELDRACGRLKTPAAFMPYIAVALVPVILFLDSKFY